MSIDIARDVLPVVLELGPTSVARAKVEVAGVDLSRYLRGVQLESRVGELTKLTLDAAPYQGVTVQAVIERGAIDVQPALRSGDLLMFSVVLLRELLQQEDDRRQIPVRVVDIRTHEEVAGGTAVKIVHLTCERAPR